MGNRLFRALLASFSVFSLLTLSVGICMADGPGPGSAGSTGATAPAPNAQTGTGPDPTGDPNYLPWNDSQNYVSCGQTCLLQKSNENLSMQALYILTRAQHLQQIVNDKNSSDSLQAQKELASLCPDLKDTKTCVERYVRTQVDTLRKIKTSIAKNQNALLYFRSDVQVGADGKVLSDGRGNVLRQPVSPNDLGEPDPGRKKSQTSYATDLKSSAVIKQAYERESANLARVASPKYQDWENGLPPSPTPEDYYMWKSVLLDPSSPQEGKVAVLLYEDGKPKIDKKALDAANLEYKARTKDLQNEKNASTDDNPTQKLKPVDDTEISDYKFARQEFVNSAPRAGVMPPQTFPGPGGNGRGPANLSTSSTKSSNKQPDRNFTTFSPEDLENQINMIENKLPDCKDHGGCSYDSPPP